MIYAPGLGVGNLGSGFGVGGSSAPGGKIRPGQRDIFGNVLMPSNDENKDVETPNSAHGVDSFPLEPETLDYLNAEYAKHYGMDRATAYQEALANSAYQRSVADMQKAGLNPAVIFGAGRGSGASSFSGSDGSARGSSGSKEDPFSISDASGLIGSAVQLVTHLITKSDSLSSAAGNAAKSLVNTVDKLFTD